MDSRCEDGGQGRGRGYSLPRRRRQFKTHPLSDFDVRWRIDSHECELIVHKVLYRDLCHRWSCGASAPFSRAHFAAQGRSWCRGRYVRHRQLLLCPVFQYYPGEGENEVAGRSMTTWALASSNFFEIPLASSWRFSRGTSDPFRQTDVLQRMNTT